MPPPSGDEDTDAAAAARIAAELEQIARRLAVLGHQLVGLQERQAQVGERHDPGTVVRLRPDRADNDTSG